MPGLDKMLIIPDTHAPYHDARAWALMMQVAKANKPDIILTLGDFADCYSVSSHRKDPRRINMLDEELAEVNGLLDQLDSLGAKRKVFVEGNHSQRLTRYLQDQAPELFNVVSVQKLLKIKKRNWEWVPYLQDIKIGRVYYTHEAGAGTGRPQAYKTLDTYHHSVVTGHGHRTQYVVEGDATGNAMVSAQFGWLGDLSKIDYAHRIKATKDWSLGFGWGYLRENGLTYLQPITIVDYSCIVNGRLYTQAAL
jgi:predicted phosphodiesterase